jgi:outer membrane assembly lipoprotein YfiO
VIARPFLPSVVIAATSLILFPLTTQAEFVYRSGEGWTWDGGFFGFSAPVAKSADLLISLAEDSEKKGDLSKARGAYERLVKDFPFSNQAATAKFRIAQVLDKQGKYEPAFDSYDTYISKHPDGNEFNAALDAMFVIAKRFMDGERRRLLGIKAFTSSQRAEEMFDTILKRAPYSQIAAQVMLYRGMMLERQGKDAEAIATYQGIIERFPGDRVADEAQYQMGFVRMRSVRGGSNDKVDRVRAQESFEDYISRAPSNEKSAQARENLQVLEKNHVKSILEVAKFYDKTGKVKSAVIYYRDVIRESANAPEAQFAKKRLEELKQQFGADAVRVGNEPAENADNAASKRRMQSAINTVSRPDYVGPQVKSAPESRAKSGPSLRLSPSDLNPQPELALPLNDPIVNPAGSAPKEKQ